MKNKSGVMPANEFGQLRACLAKLKVRQADINAAIGNGADGRTRAEVATALIAWLARSSPPMVPLLNIPLTSQWTWDHVVQPVKKLLGGAK